MILNGGFLKIDKEIGIPRTFYDVRRKYKGAIPVSNFRSRRYYSTC